MTEIPKKLPRLYVNIFGAPLLLGAIYFGNLFFIGLFFIVSLFCIYEFNNLCNKMNYQLIKILPYTMLILILLSNFNIIKINIEHIFLLSIILGMVFSVFLNLEEPINSISITIFCIVWIGLFFYSSIEIRNLQDNGLVLTGVMFVSVWICDSAAYIFGKKFGKKKIAPLISPKKTWIGSISGLIFTHLFLFSFYYYNWFDYNYSLNTTVLLGLIFGGVSQFGDLFESKLKRIAKIKDSSQLLQGHGGFLDRFDSLLITTPATLLILNLLESI
jgi:phosphatidate cytidylyltransferase